MSSDTHTVCPTCGRVVGMSPLRLGAEPNAATFFTLDDHDGPDGRCGAVGDVVSRGGWHVPRRRDIGAGPVRR